MAVVVDSFHKNCCFMLSTHVLLLRDGRAFSMFLYLDLLYFVYLLFFFPSHLLSSPFYSPSLLVVTQIRGHIAGSSPPLPTTVRALQFFYREKISALSSLVASRRIVLTHARRSQQLLILFYFGK